MKCKVTELEKEFTPFELTFTVESLEEARAWHRLFNCDHLTAAIGFPNSNCDELIYKACPKAYDVDDHRKFVKTIQNL